MKTISLITCAILSLLLSGCGQKETKTGSNPVMAPVEYLDAAAKAKISSEKILDTVAVNQAIQMFSTQEGRYPTNLDELVSTGYLRQLPKPPYGMKLVYDATKGEVSVVKQ